MTQLLCLEDMKLEAAPTQELLVVLGLLPGEPLLVQPLDGAVLGPVVDGVARLLVQRRLPTQHILSLQTLALDNKVIQNRNEDIESQKSAIKSYAS